MSGENAYLVVDARAVRLARVGGSMVTFGVTGDEFDGALARHVEVLDPDGNSLSLAALP